MEKIHVTGSIGMIGNGHVTARRTTPMAADRLVSAQQPPGDRFGAVQNSQNPDMSIDFAGYDLAGVAGASAAVDSADFSDFSSRSDAMQFESEMSFESSSADGGYAALLEPHREPGQRQHDLHVTPLFSVAIPVQMPIERSTATDSKFGLARFEPEDESAEQFSIAHPIWGHLEVDSKKHGAHWEIRVRCDDDGTRARLMDREHEFRALLRNDYGMQLSLDVQPTSTR